MPVAAIGKLRGFRFFGRQREERYPAVDKRGIFFPALLLGVALVGLALLHVWVRLQVIHLGYVLSTTSKVQSQLEQENRELKLEITTLTSPESLEQKARARLGLRAPEKGQVVILP